jgi:hypothetical protein
MTNHSSSDGPPVLARSAESSAEQGDKVRSDQPDVRESIRIFANNDFI